MLISNTLTYPVSMNYCVCSRP